MVFSMMTPFISCFNGKKKTCIKMWHCKALFYESVSLISALLGCSLYVTVYFIFISKFMCFGTPCIMQHLDF